MKNVGCCIIIFVKIEVLESFYIFLRLNMCQTLLGRSLYYEPFWKTIPQFVLSKDIVSNALRDILIANKFGANSMA